MATEIISVRAADGTSLAVGSYLGARGGPVTLVVHGIASHMGWYHGLAEALQAEGVTVYMPDRRGVALSGGIPGHTNRWRTLEDDLSRIASEIERRHPRRPIHAIGISLGGVMTLASSILRPGRPIHAIGISLGGVITLASSILHPGLFRSQILLSPALAASITFPLLRRIEIFWRALSAPRKLYDLPFGVKDLTDNLDWRTVLFEESKRNQVTARFLLETLQMQRFVRKHIKHVDAPILALFGERDLVVDNKTSIDILGKSGSALVRVEVFESMSHILAASAPSSHHRGSRWAAARWAASV